MTDDRITLAPMKPGDIVIGDRLIVLHPDGSVTGRVEDANEAGRVFMAYIRANWGGR